MVINSCRVPERFSVETNPIVMAGAKNARNSGAWLKNGRMDRTLILEEIQPKQGAGDQQKQDHHDVGHDAAEIALQLFLPDKVDVVHDSTSSWAGSSDSRSA
ncbi:MAG: hypothetical protein R3E66_14255 [bacterium]